ncbi:hypothetical protein SAMN05444858_102102 [Micromonospora avicenniae]|uniref:Uncharacterized protein n=1 Tax=Micromonospora avicenniae TaxID=1198245 RepID=A0A1N6S599_9ACTN|nr:hypothetical protein SAMN05444858_102102 [Micromonospora avicenniae]
MCPAPREPVWPTLATIGFMLPADPFVMARRLRAIGQTLPGDVLLRQPDEFASLRATGIALKAGLAELEKASEAMAD